MDSYIVNGINITESDGSIFDTRAQAIVNPVNLVGVMGAGLALEFKQRYPDAFRVYRSQCRNRQFNLGQVLVYYIYPKNTPPMNPEMIIHFPTKFHWKESSDYGIIEEGLDALVSCINNNRIESIAIPPLGCGYGGLEREAVKTMILDSICPKAGLYLRSIELLQF